MSSLIDIVLSLLKAWWEWLKKLFESLLSNPWRTLFLAASLALGWMALEHMAQENRYIVLQGQYDKDTRDLKLTIADQDLKLQSYQRQEEKFAKSARERTDALDAARQSSEVAMTDLAAKQKAAEASNKGWWIGFEKRPDVCRAAQEAMGVACAPLGEF